MKIGFRARGLPGGGLPASGRGASLALALLVAGLAAGCASDFASPLSVVVVAYDVKQAQYRFGTRTLLTLTSVRRMEGRSGTVLAGGAAHPDATAYLEAGASVAGLRGRLFTEQAQPVDLSFNLIKTAAGDVLYAENYTSLELLTAYANLEQARANFATWGLTPALQLAPIFAHTPLLTDRGLSVLADGELYYPPLGAFFLPAPSLQSQLPLHFNLGAVAHGVALQAYQQIVWRLAPVDPANAAPQSDPDALVARHVGASVSQGIADFLGAAVSADPRWFDHSLQQQAGARALDQLRCGTGDMLQALDVDDEKLPYNPYPLGTVLAFSLWEATSEADVAPVARGVLAALQGIGSAQSGNGGKLSLAAALDALVAAAAEDLKPGLCGSFHNRFAGLSIGKDDLPSCQGLVEVPPAELCQ